MPSKYWIYRPESFKSQREKLSALTRKLLLKDWHWHLKNSTSCHRIWTFTCCLPTPVKLAGSILVPLPLSQDILWAALHQEGWNAILEKQGTISVTVYSCLFCETPVAHLFSQEQYCWLKGCSKTEAVSQPGKSEITLSTPKVISVLEKWICLLSTAPDVSYCSWKKQNLKGLDSKIQWCGALSLFQSSEWSVIWGSPWSVPFSNHWRCGLFLKPNQATALTRGHSSPVTRQITKWH